MCTDVLCFAVVWRGKTFSYLFLFIYRTHLRAESELIVEWLWIAGCFWVKEKKVESSFFCHGGVQSSPEWIFIHSKLKYFTVVVNIFENEINHKISNFLLTLSLHLNLQESKIFIHYQNVQKKLHLFSLNEILTSISSILRRNSFLYFLAWFQNTTKCSRWRSKCLNNSLKPESKRRDLSTYNRKTFRIC